MSLESPCARRFHVPSPALLGRGAWLALLPVEVLWLTLRFDAGSLAGTDSPWAGLMVHARWLPQLAFVVAAALFLFGRDRLGVALRQAADARTGWPRWPFALAHVPLFAAFAALTEYLLEGGALATAWAGALVLVWLSLAGLTLALWGAALLPANLWLSFGRRGLLPGLGGLAVGLLAWAAAQLTPLLWLPLARCTLWVVHGLLLLVAADPVCRPQDFVVGVPGFVVEIAPQCSGYEGIGLIWVFLAAYLWVYRAELRFPRSLLLVPLATVVVWLANAGRIAALILLGAWGSPEVALGGFHSQAGWLAFNAVALGLVLLVRRVPHFHRPAEARAPLEGGSPAAYLLPLLVLVATLMVTGAFSRGGFDWLYPVRVVTVAIALALVWRHHPTLLRSWSWQAVLLGAVVFPLWLALAHRPPDSDDRALADALASVPPVWALVWLVFRVLGSVVTVPLAEEMAFRGYLLRRLTAADFEAAAHFSWPACLASSVLFGLLHGAWLAGTLAGIVYALAFYRRRDLNDAVLAHATTNALIAIYVLATGSAYLWS